MSKSYGPIALAFLLLAAWPATAEAQGPTSPHRLTFGWGLGALVSMPEDFESAPCGNLFALEAGAGVGFAVTDIFHLESFLAASFARPVPCSVDPLPPPENGSVVRSVFGDGATQNPFLITTHRVLIDPVPSKTLSPRGFVGGGRLWSQGIWFWSAGVGLGLGSGGAGWTLEVERTAFGLRFVEETRTYSGGELVETRLGPRMTQDESMWSVRVRHPIGRR